MTPVLIGLTLTAIGIGCYLLGYSKGSEAQDKVWLEEVDKIQRRLCGHD